MNTNTRCIPPVQNPMIASNTTVRSLILLIEDESQHNRLRQAATEQLIQIIQANPSIYNALARQNIHTIQNLLGD